MSLELAPNTGKCMFCEKHTDLPIGCDECWNLIVSKNVNTSMVFGAGDTDVSYSEIVELKKWTHLGNE